MNLIEVIERFPDQASCIAHLERIRWRGTPVCPQCGSLRIKRKNENGVGRVGRWNCHDCNASFKVTCKTVFHGTKMPLQKWFLAIALILNAKKGVSSYQLQRDLGLNQKTAWYILTRIRAEMSKKGGALLQGIIEADETYIGGKPRKANKKEDREPAKRGRGTDKTPVIGAFDLKNHTTNVYHIFIDFIDFSVSKERKKMQTLVKNETQQKATYDPETIDADTMTLSVSTATQKYANWERYQNGAATFAEVTALIAIRQWLCSERGVDPDSLTSATHVINAYNAAKKKTRRRFCVS